MVFTACLFLLVAHSVQILLYGSVIYGLVHRAGAGVLGRSASCTYIAMERFWNAPEYGNGKDGS
ncbi:MAG: hypothetical protein IPP91_05395 [Betaproteobacteria bacterium]|nr:hypothetical protein [Betaproteobacteria bacterium]